MTDERTDEQDFEDLFCSCPVCNSQDELFYVNCCSEEWLLCYVRDANLRGHILTLGNGSEFAIRINAQRGQWHCFDWDDWTQFCKEAKKERKAQRREAVRGIDTTEIYALAL